MGKRWFALSRGQASPPARWLRDRGILVAAVILATGGALALLWYDPICAVTVPSTPHQCQACLLLSALGCNQWGEIGDRTQVERVVEVVDSDSRGYGYAERARLEDGSA
jgi:hypothetical protein